MFNWEPIFTEVSQPNTNMIYFGIGSAMGHYNREINDHENQQYPPFLNKFMGKKLVILFDPDLEAHLAVESYMEKHNYAYDKYAVDETITILRSADLVVYAIKEAFEFGVGRWLEGEERLKLITKVDWYVSNMINLIGICLNKAIKTKVILQDFTGRDTTDFYVKLFGTFDKSDVLNNVMFDVTQKDGGCFIEMNESHASLDPVGNFIQEKHMELTRIRQSNLFDIIVRDRISSVLYTLSYNYTALKNNKQHQIDQIDKIIYLAHTYNIDFDELNTNYDYLDLKLKQLIRGIIIDVIRAKDIDSSAVDDLMSVIDNRPLFVNSLCLFNYQ